AELNREPRQRESLADCASAGVFMQAPKGYFSSVMYSFASGLTPLLKVPTQMSYCPDCGLSILMNGLRVPSGPSSLAIHFPLGRLMSKVVSSSEVTWNVSGNFPAL